jgi:hypothetical protein
VDDPSSWFLIGRRSDLCDQIVISCGGCTLSIFYFFSLFPLNVRAGLALLRVGIPSGCLEAADRPGKILVCARANENVRLRGRHLCCIPLFLLVKMRRDPTMAESNNLPRVWESRIPVLKPGPASSQSSAIYFSFSFSQPSINQFLVFVRRRQTSLACRTFPSRHHGQHYVGCQSPRF